MKKLISFLVIIFATDLLIQASDFLSTPAGKSDPSPTFKGDEHDQPVFTSPTNSSSLPLTTNLPPMPSMTNLPSTNLPPMTNWPANQPPADHN